MGVCTNISHIDKYRMSVNTLPKTRLCTKHMLFVFCTVQLHLFYVIYEICTKINLNYAECCIMNCDLDYNSILCMFYNSETRYPWYSKIGNNYVNDIEFKYENTRVRNILFELWAPSTTSFRLSSASNWIAPRYLNTIISTRMWLLFHLT
jgi:hypothetical protein